MPDENPTPTPALSDLAFELTRATIQLRATLSAGDLAGAIEISDALYDLVGNLGEVVVHVDDVLNARNERLAEQQKAKIRKAF